MKLKKLEEKSSSYRKMNFKNLKKFFIMFFNKNDKTVKTLINNDFWHIKTNVKNL